MKQNNNIPQGYSPRISRINTKEIISENSCNSWTKNSNIPQGYKDSPLGIIPEEWEVKKLGEFGTFLKGKGVPKDKITTSGFKCLTYGDIYTKYDIVMKNIKSFINEDITAISQELKTGDILFAGSGETLEDIGKCIAYLDKDKAYAGGDIIIFRQSEMNSLVLSYLLNSSKSNSQKFQMGQGHSVVHIYSSQLENLLVPRPPLPEQQKIAEILSTWDAAIEKQTQIIAQLETRKRGLMQQFLTGKKRLKGFEGEWREVKLGEILTIGNGKDYHHLQQGNIPVFGTGGLMTSVNDYLYDGETVCIGRKGTIDKPMYFNGKLWTVDTLFYTHSFIATCPNFIYYMFLLIDWINYNEASGVPSLSKTTIERIKIKIPPFAEQTAIAAILSTADKEIDLAKKKLTGLKGQKKGLIQVLLTGKKRVKILEI